MTAAIDIKDIPAHRRLSTKLAFSAAVAALGDWLFYGHDVGVSLALFLFALAAGTYLMRPDTSDRRSLWISAIVLPAALLPLLEESGRISVLFGVLGTALAAIVITGGVSRRWDAIAASTRNLILVGPFQIVFDLLQARQDARSQGRKTLRLDLLSGWIIPVLCCIVFTLLLASANPLIERWLTIFDLSRVQWEIDIMRVVAWVLLLAIAWPFLSVRLCERSPSEKGKPTAALPVIAGSNPVFGTASITRSLILFNLLFAAQSALDAVYLWGGAALPDGMTYATYAHRGAYPLIVTALLAAGFVLAAMQPGGGGERSPVIRRLVYLWVAQNILLVISSILRLELYVATYSLTSLRVAAFVWMVLVAIGLALIISRIALRRSNGWLVGANVLALALTFYICGFVNFAAVIANHNLSNRRTSMPSPVSVDTHYVQTLGPHVIPAVDRYIARNGAEKLDHLVQWRGRAAAAHLERMKDWRAWTFRGMRLQHYLNDLASAKETPATIDPIVIP